MVMLVLHARFLAICNVCKCYLPYLRYNIRQSGMSSIIRNRIDLHTIFLGRGRKPGPAAFTGRCLPTAGMADLNKVAMA